jgi:trans-2,3-dihydro-3-hydroxyanthranilate isomerase
MTHRDPEFGKIHDPDEIAKATGISLADIQTSLPIQTVSTGFAFAIVPLRSLETLSKLEVDLKKAEAYLATTDASLFFFVTPDSDRKAGLRARMLFYGGEDPATGSASGCAAAWMVRHRLAKPDEQVIITQGVEMKRPSRIFVRASLEASRVHNVRVGGYCAEIMRGELTLP